MLQQAGRVWVGSPPHVRGKEAHNAGDGAVHRITPAYAGKRTGPEKDAPRRWDHPRVCGEKLMNRVKHIDPHRITPACAGKSYLIGTGLGDTKDHPRVCGEKGAGIKLSIASMGSPPHMRGKAMRPLLPAGGGRITPACAGKSHHIPAHTGKLRDHPRMCGEKCTVGKSS